MLLLNVSTSAICRFLLARGFTQQKLQITASQQDVALQQQFVMDVSIYSHERLIFIDETGADRRNKLRKYGYCIRGKPLRSYKLLVCGERVSAISCISMAGGLDVMTVHGTANDDIFYQFIHTRLSPHLILNPHSVVIMDNYSPC